MPEQPPMPGPPMLKLPPSPAPAPPGSVVVYHKATGEALSCTYAVDARELVESGEYQREPVIATEAPTDAEPAAEAPIGSAVAPSSATPPAPKSRRKKAT